MLFCCSYCGVRVLVSGVLFGTNFDLPVDLKNGVFGEDHSKHIMDASKKSCLSFFSREVLFFSSHKGFPFFVLRPWKLGHSFLLWLDEDDMKNGQILLVAMTLVSLIAEGGGLKMQLDFREK